MGILRGEFCLQNIEQPQTVKLVSRFNDPTADGQHTFIIHLLSEQRLEISNFS